MHGIVTPLDMSDARGHATYGAHHAVEAEEKAPRSGKKRHDQGKHRHAAEAFQFRRIAGVRGNMAGKFQIAVFQCSTVYTQILRLGRQICAADSSLIARRENGPLAVEYIHAVPVHLGKGIVLVRQHLLLIRKEQHTAGDLQAGADDLPAADKVLHQGRAILHLFSAEKAHLAQTLVFI